MVRRREIPGAYFGPEANLCSPYEEHSNQVRQDHQDALLAHQPTVPSRRQLEAAAVQDGVQAIDDLRISCVVRLRCFPPEETPSEAEPAVEDDVKPGSFQPDRRCSQDGEN